MKHLFILLVITGASLVAGAQQPSPKAGRMPLPKARALDSVMRAYAPSFLPGVALAVYSEAEGWWKGAAGLASLEKKTPMRADDLQYLQSVSKMYLAAEMLMLKEKARINFDEPLTRYLPSRYAACISNAADITVRMLLNHTSGVPEYNSEPGFVSKLLLHPLDDFSPADCLEAIRRYQPQFAPGSRYAYTNTNYLLLALIADSITGDHAAFIREHIFKPLHLEHSYYARDTRYLDKLPLTESYWDALNVGAPANITPFQKMTVACSKGDDGIVCTPEDAVRFLKALMEGELLAPSSLEEMLHFVTDENSHKRYGMGMIYFDLGGMAAYGHGGGGVGSGCVLAYIPSRKIYLYLATNLGVLVDGKLSEKANDLKMQILGILLQ